MKITLSTKEVISHLLNDGYANWSYDACIALADYYESLEEEVGREIELDVVAIRCDWAELKSFEDAIEHFKFEVKSKDPQIQRYEFENFLGKKGHEYTKCGKGYLVKQR
jgi:hypothetical protein